MALKLRVKAYASCCGNQDLESLCLPCRKRLRKCIACTRPRPSPPTLWWLCQSSVLCAPTPVRMRGPSTSCCCSCRRRRESLSWSRMERRCASMPVCECMHVHVCVFHGLTVTWSALICPGLVVDFSACVVGTAVICPCPPDCEVCQGTTCQGVSCQRCGCWGLPADAE